MPDPNGPPNKWSKFSKGGLSSTDVLNALNDLAAEGYTGPAIELECTDGDFVFVAGYGD
jgi:hypothetical protein